MDGNRGIVARSVSAMALGMLFSAGALAITDGDRRLAVQEVLRGPTCSYVRAQNPATFYWEIGNADGVVYASRYQAHRNTSMHVESASKWIYGAYYVQTYGWPTGYDLYRLNQTSHVTTTNPQGTYIGGAFVVLCSKNGTVAGCAAANVTNPGNDPTQRAFSYDAAHFISLAAADPKLAADDNQALGIDISTGVGMPSNSFAYWEPSVAGGVDTTPGNYATFLQGLLKGAQGSPGGLRLGSHLDYGLACSTNPSPGNPVPSAQYPTQWFAAHTPFDNTQVCQGNSRTEAGGSENSPFPYLEVAAYGIAHWREYNGVDSSPGAFGFYPWVDSDAGLYGLVAADTQPGQVRPDAPAVDSMYCGRNIRNAWETGVAHDPYAPYYQQY